MPIHQIAKIQNQDKVVLEFKELKDPNTILVTEIVVTLEKGKWKTFPVSERVMRTSDARVLWVQKKKEGFVIVSSEN